MIFCDASQYTGHQEYIVSYSGLQMKPLRVLFFGMLGQFSLPPLKALIEAGISVCGIIVPSENKTQAIKTLESVTAVSTLLLTPTQPTIVHLGWQHHIPVYEVSRLSAAKTQQLLAHFQPDAACVACFNKRIPNSLLKLPRHGFLNVHPSLLPQFRGPAPLFWTFHAGIQDTGVTVHLMDDSLDTGAIVQQAPFSLPDGISGPEADKLAGTLGGQLLVKTINQLATNTFAPIPQPNGGSTQSWPQAADFRVPVSWSAQRAFNFMRGTAEFGQPFVIELEDREIVVKTAVSYTQNATLNKLYKTLGDTIQIQFADGVVTAVPISLW
jgi:methionyl-tRNA formyltransferase